LTHTYDAVGNRLTKTDGGARTTYVYDNANQTRRSQDSTGITTYLFDASGNLGHSQNASNQRTTYTWDFENRLVKLALSSGTRNTFAYNGDGMRVQKQDSAGTSNFLWDLQNVLEETDGTGSTQVVYSLEPAIYGNLLSERRGSSASYYHFDGLGSADRLTDSSGTTVVNSYVYDGYGNLRVSSETVTNPFKFVGRAGYYFDGDLAKYLLRARYYDPQTARFLSRDQSIRDFYRYGRSNPINTTDPSGFLAVPCDPCNFSGDAGWIFISCNCKGLLQIWIIPEADPPSPCFPATCGKWIKADGFVVTKGTFKVDGSTCNYFSCTGPPLGVTITCCRSRLAALLGSKCPPYRVPPGTFGGPPKEPGIGQMPPPYVQ
jgi:RHS repeat-associated protein